jgi:hypothetical protein
MAGRSVVPFALAISVVTFCAASYADSKTQIGGDLDMAFPIDSSGNTGAGFGIRLGQQWHVPLIALTPEIGFTYHGFSGDDAPSTYRGIAGLRLGIGEVLRIGPYGHLGYGHFTPAHGSSDNGFTYDVGGFLDITLLPFFDFGVHGGYTHVDVADVGGSFAFGTVGRDAALLF